MHALVAQRDEIGHPGGLLRGEERGGVGTIRARRPLGMGGAGNGRPGGASDPGALGGIEVDDGSAAGGVGHGPILTRRRPGVAIRNG